MIEEEPKKPWPIIGFYFEGTIKITVYQAGYAEGADRDDIIKYKGKPEIDEPF